MVELVVQQSLLLSFALVSELFHIAAHTNVLLRISPPSLASLKLKRWYFVYDFASLLFAFFLTRAYWGAVFIHLVIHIWYVYNWNRGYYAIRIRDWSVREYKGKWITTDFFLTCYDIGIHALMAWGLFQMNAAKWQFKLL